MSLEIGQIIEGKYRIVRLIGEGGMGAVYEGENTRIQRRVAIKVLHSGIAENREAVQRFEREAQAAGRIGSDHILEVLDLGTFPNGDHFMVMEFLDGEPLTERIRRFGRLTPEQLVPLTKQVLAGLSSAHGAGIVHRDLKPDNIFVLKSKAGRADFVKLIDFGISKFQPVGGEFKMTRTGTVMGTPYYMSPEQASGSREADARSDLYAVGVIMYEAVTGRVPFDAPTFNQLLFQIVLSEAPHPQQLNTELDPAFASIIMKAMARDVQHRFQSADEMAGSLDAWLERRAAVTIPPATDATALLPNVRAAMGSAPGTGPYPAVGGATPPGVVPAPGAATPPHFAPAATGAAGGAPVPVQTSGSWASSQLSAGGGKSKAPLIAAAIAGGLLLLGGGVLAAVLLGGGSDASETASAQPVSEPVPAAVPSPTPEPKVEPAPAPAAPPSEATAAAEPSAEPPAAKETATKELAAPRPAAKPASRPVAAKPPPKPTSKPTGTKPAAKPGSKAPDFGY